jgi:hypothetical protein
LVKPKVIPVEELNPTLTKKVRSLVTP